MLIGTAEAVSVKDVKEAPIFPVSRGRAHTSNVDMPRFLHILHIRSPGHCRTLAALPLQRRHAFADECSQFLYCRWAGEAVPLRWGRQELLGCDCGSPIARIERTGLLWLLNGRRLVAMTDAAAVIACAAGVHQAYRRAATQPGRVLAWEIER